MPTARTEVTKCKDCDDWRVETFEDSGDCYVALFSGPRPQERAEFYGSLLTGEALKAALLGA